MNASAPQNARIFIQKILTSCLLNLKCFRLACRYVKDDSRNLPRKPNNLVSEEPRQNKRRGLGDRKLVEAPSNFIVGRLKAVLLFWFFDGFRCGLCIFIVLDRRLLGLLRAFLIISSLNKSRKENPQKLTQLSSRSHPRHVVGKRTAQKDTIIDITSDSQVNSNFPNRWSPASLTFNNHFYLFLYLCIT